MDIETAQPPFEQFNTFDDIDHDAKQDTYPLITLNSLATLKNFKKYYRVDGFGVATLTCIVCLTYTPCYHHIGYITRPPPGNIGSMTKRMGVCNTCWMEGRMAVPILKDAFIKDVRSSVINDVLINDVVNIIIEYAAPDTATMIYLPYDNDAVLRHITDGRKRRQKESFNEKLGYRPRGKKFRYGKTC